MSETQQIRAVIEDLITAGTTFDIDALDQIYHDDLRVLMINAEGELGQANKADFKAMFAAKRAAGDPPLNTWARFEDITCDGSAAHVLIARQVKLAAEEERITLSIDLIYEAGRWQVTREVIFRH